MLTVSRLWSAVLDSGCNLFQKPPPHPEEPRSGVSKDTPVLSEAALVLRDGLAGLLRMRALDGPAYRNRFLSEKKT